MSSEFGKTVRVSLFGESHGDAVGAVVEGFPCGFEIDFQALNSFMKRRSGGGELVTERAEKDKPRFVSGVRNGVTCGSPVCIFIENSDAHSSDYDNNENIPRPGHADYTAFMKWHGAADMRGGGHFSGRLTAPLCAAGGIALQILAQTNIFIGAHLLHAGGIEDKPFPLIPDRVLFSRVAAKDFPVIDDECGEKMKKEIKTAHQAGDSVGAVVECAVTGLPAGVGEPMFDGIENSISRVLFGIPAVKGIEFGSGFAGADKKGSENNDAFILENGKIISPSNNCGGILGGITTGMPLVFRVAIKPTPSIAKQQQSVNITTGIEQTVSTVGRHDACIGIRAVPAVEAAAALVVLDLLAEARR